MGPHPLRRFDLRRLISFPLLREPEARPSPSPTEEELLFELAGENPGNLLFGRFDEREVRSRLARAGVLDGIEQRGFPNPLLRLECEDPTDQRVFLYAGSFSRDRLLLEARLQLRRFRLRKGTPPFPAEHSFRMLIIHWLELSDPDRPFPVDRPRLPGQRKPGLGLLAQSLDLLRNLGRDLSIDGVLDVPDHFHTALFYAREFRFLDRGIEGRFLAIARDVKGAPLALASEAIDLGCLIDRDTGRTAAWEAVEQVLPLRGLLRKYLLSAEYRRARDQAFLATRTAIDWNAYREKIAGKGPAANTP